MSALPGTIDEWTQGKDGAWRRRGHPEDGVIKLREGLDFKDYYAKRADPPPPMPDKIADLEARIAKLEAEVLKSV